MSTQTTNTTIAGVVATGNVTSTTPAKTTQNIIDTNSIQTGTNNISITNDEDDKCAINLKDYESVRKEMKNDIDDYYNKVLGLYTQNYDDYLSNVNSTDQDKIDFALTQLKPMIKGYNKQLITINQKLIDRVNSVSKLIEKQKKSLESNRNEINDNYVKIEKLENRRKQLKTEIEGNQNYLNDVEGRTETDSVYKYLYIGVNILLLIIIIATLSYMLM